MCRVCLGARPRRLCVCAVSRSTNSCTHTYIHAHQPRPSRIFLLSVCRNAVPLWRESGLWGTDWAIIGDSGGRWKLRDKEREAQRVTEGVMREINQDGVKRGNCICKTSAGAHGGITTIKGARNQMSWDGIWNELLLGWIRKIQNN